MLRFGPFRFDRESKLLYHAGEELPVRPKVRAMLDLFLSQPGRVFSKDELVEALWNGVSVGDNSLSEVISVLRRTLGDDPQNPAYIQTVHGRGFRFIAEVIEVEPGDFRVSTAWRFRAGIGILVAIVAAVILGLARSPSYPPTPMRLALPFPLESPVNISGSSSPTFALSPDGRKLAYIGLAEHHRGNHDQTIFLRSLDSEMVRRLSTPFVPHAGFYSEAGEGGVESLFFSADGERLGYFEAGQLKVVSTNDGKEKILATGAFFARGAAFLGDGSVIANIEPSAGLSLLKPGATRFEPLTVPDLEAGEHSHRWPSVLPGERGVVFMVFRPTRHYEDFTIEALDLERGERMTLIEGGGYPRYAGSGHLLYVRNEKLWAARFDPKRLALVGAARPVEQPILALPSGAAFYDVSSNGTLAYMPAYLRSPGKSTLVWVDADGRRTSLRVPSRTYRAPVVSPDGTRVAFGAGNRLETDVWVLDVERETMQPLTRDGLSNVPIWSPDGSRLVFRSARDGHGADLYEMPSNGSGRERPLVQSAQSKWPNSFSPDGRYILYTVARDQHDIDIEVYDYETGESRPFIDDETAQMNGQFSPDGRHVAYASTDSGTWHIYVVTFPEAKERVRVTTEPMGGWPLWSRGGNILYHRTSLPHSRIVAVPVLEHWPRIRFGEARELFEENYSRWMRATTSYGVVPGEERFVFVDDREGFQKADRVHLVLGWFDELERRLDPTENR